MKNTKETIFNTVLLISNCLPNYIVKEVLFLDLLDNFPYFLYYCVPNNEYKFTHSELDFNKVSGYDLCMAYKPSDKPFTFDSPDLILDVSTKYLRMHSLFCYFC